MTKCNISAARRVRLIGIFAAVLWSLAAPRTATAQSFGVAKFLAGGAVALGMHEAGHVVLDLAAGASPGLEGVRFGTLPFFAITHEPVSPVREFAISSAGFCVQHASSEIILTRRPRLRDEQAPVLKGMLAFNVLASVAYAGAVFGGVGPEERDTRGMALAADVAEPIVGVMLLMPAALDAMRYYRPEARWVRWVSRAAKAGGVVLIARSL